MKRSITHSLSAFTCTTILLLPHTASAQDVGLGRITEFTRSKTKCYCSPDNNKKPLKVESKLLNKFLDLDKANGFITQSTPDYKKARIEIPATILEKAIDPGCHKNSDTTNNKPLTCWVKTHYVKGVDIQIKKVVSSEELGLGDSQPYCKDLGSVLGAGSCKKQR